MGAIGFVRHGETEWNRLGRIQGSLDIPLSKTGQMQAEAFAFTIRDRGIGQIWTSPLRRATETAVIIGTALQHGGIITEMHEMDGLRERHYGHYQGCYLSHLQARRQLADSEQLIVDRGVEPWQQLERRVCRAVRMLGNQLVGNEAVLVVIHGGWMKALWTLLNRPHEGTQLENLECMWFDSSDLVGL